MSLYNMMCGNNPLFGMYCRILESVAPMTSIPRFRDMYTREEGGRVQIVIYTRTGGGNRKSYMDANAEMGKHPCFVGDFDDDYDSTFAHWVYAVPDSFHDALLRVHRATADCPKMQSPSVKSQRALDALGGGTEQPKPQVDADEISEAIASLLDMLPEEPSTAERELCPPQG